MYYVSIVPQQPSYELYHYGIQGMKWGIRRYQNPDGSLTAAGLARYGNLGRAERNDLAKYGTRTFERMRRMQSRGASHERARQYAKDRKELGRKSAEKIQRRMDKYQARDDRWVKKHGGVGHKKDTYGHQSARGVQEFSNAFKKTLAVIGGVYVGAYALKHRKTIATGAKYAKIFFQHAARAAANNANRIRNTPRLGAGRMFTESGRAANKAGRQFIRNQRRFARNQAAQRFAGRVVRNARFR